MLGELHVLKFLPQCCLLKYLLCSLPPFLLLMFLIGWWMLLLMPVLH